MRQRLAAHARANPASSRGVRRARVLPIAPSLDRGEITDKGSINQRAVLRHHADLVAELYSAAPPPHVVIIEHGRIMSAREHMAVTVGLCFLVAVLEGFDIQAMGVAAPRLAPQFALDASQMGWVFSISNIGLVIGASLGGWLADRSGRKPVLIGAVAMFGCFTLATAFAGDYQALLARAFLRGARFRRGAAQHDGHRRRDQPAGEGGVDGSDHVLRHARGRRARGADHADSSRRISTGARCSSWAACFPSCCCPRFASWMPETLVRAAVRAARARV